MFLSHPQPDVRLPAGIEWQVHELFGFEATPAQLQAATALGRAAIVELETGQGKTLTGALAAIAQAATGRGVWLCTANDYLAQRDADWMKPLYDARGLRVGVITAEVPQAERRRAYEADVVYGTLREFGFDWLRSRLAERRPGRQAAALEGKNPFNNALLVDEADSLLIDEAVVPLVLAQTAPEDPAEIAALHWAAAESTAYQPGRDFELAAGGRLAVLTPAGRSRFLTRALPAETVRCSHSELLEHLERALLVSARYLRDRDYVVQDGRVRIVDEFTGRTAEGRSWNAGVHQAIEAREGLSLTRRTRSAARITTQEFVSRFRHVSGMTGTAAESAREFRSVYGLRVRPIAPHQPSQRLALPPVVKPTVDSQREAIVEESAKVVGNGRAVLIGARTVEASEQLSDRFRKRGVEHVVLNARAPEREAQIVSQAGQAGRVTIATNMAGRGTDIRLAPGVREAGGLHVLITELNSSPRIDRQLIGRCGRQGDPGSYRFLLSDQDAIAQEAFQHAADTSAGGLARLQQAQRVLQRRQFDARQLLRLSAARRQQDAATLGLDPVLDPLDD